MYASSLMPRARQASAKIRSPPQAPPQIARSPASAPAFVSVASMAALATSSLSGGKRGSLRPGASIMCPLKRKTWRGGGFSFDMGHLEGLASRQSDPILVQRLPVQQDRVARAAEKTPPAPRHLSDNESGWALF